MASRFKLTMVAGKPVWTERPSSLAEGVDDAVANERAALAAWWGIYFRQRQYRNDKPEAGLLSAI